MSEFLLGIILIAIAGMICLGMVLLIFKKSIIAVIGSAVMVVVTIIADFGYVVGAKGLFQLVWTFPVAIVFLLALFFFVRFSHVVSLLTDEAAA